MTRGVSKSGSPTPRLMTSSIVAAMSKNRRMPDGGTTRHALRPGRARRVGGAGRCRSCRSSSPGRRRQRQESQRGRVGPPRLATMRSVEIGVVLPIMQSGRDRETTRWPVLRDMARGAEAVGVDTVWTPDELLWLGDGRSAIRRVGRRLDGGRRGSRGPRRSRSGRGSCRHSTGTRASSPRRPRPSTRSAAGDTCSGWGRGRVARPGARVRAAGGRRSSPASTRRSRSWIPLLRGWPCRLRGHWHADRDLTQRPVGPRPNRIPILIGGNGPKGQRHAAIAHADIWSWLRRGAGGSRGARRRGSGVRGHLHGGRSRSVQCRGDRRGLGRSEQLRAGGGDPT